MQVKSTVKLNMPRIQQLSQAAVIALRLTAEELHTEVVQAQVIPFDDPRVESHQEYGVRGQFAKNGHEYKGKTVYEKVGGGHLQNESTFVDYSESDNGKATLVSSTPYARRLYYHPEYNFDTGENPSAGGEWYKPWIDGGKKDFAKKAFGGFYKRVGGV